MKLGDIDVARIGLGTNRLTRTRDHVAFVKAAVAAGVQMIDTAHSYTGGESEATIGAAFVPFFPLRGDGGGALAAIAQRHRATPRQITLAWLLRRSPAMLPIPGTMSLEHLKENLAALEIELTDAEFETLR
jgi:pyridoxine 4-dehydrogenase